MGGKCYTIICWCSIYLTFWHRTSTHPRPHNFYTIFLEQIIHWILQQYTKHQQRIFYILCEIFVEHKCMGLGCISKNPHTRHSTNAGLLLGQRRRRWTNSKPALVQCPVFAGSDMGQCRSSLSAAANTHETRKESPWGTHHNLNQIGMATNKQPRLSRDDETMLV